MKKSRSLILSLTLAATPTHHKSLRATAWEDEIMSFYAGENSESHPVKRRRSASPQPSSLGWIVAHEATLLRGHDALAALTEAHGGEVRGGRMVEWVHGTVGEDEERIYVDR